MLKEGYKVLIIKDGQFALKQLRINRVTILVSLSALTVFFLGFHFLINSFTSNSLSKKNNIIDSQLNEISILKEVNTKQSEKLNHYEETINAQITDNKEKLVLLEKQLQSNNKTSDKIVKVLFDSKGISKEVRKAGSGGSRTSGYMDIDVFDDPVINDLYGKSSLITDNVKNFIKRVNIEKINLDDIKNKLFSEKYLDYWLSKPSRMPLDIRKGIYISSYYGYREDPIDNKKQFHSGDDFSADAGTPVKSTADGKVVEAGYDNRLGYNVVINHGRGYKTVYGHLQKGLTVKKGDQVHRGQTIGTVGSSGRSTAPHLHYEVKRYGKADDPRKFYTYDYKLEDLIYYK